VVEKKWKYILMLNDGGTYFADTLWGLFVEIISHRWFHFRRGDGWMD